MTRIPLIAVQYAQLSRHKSNIFHEEKEGLLTYLSYLVALQVVKPGESGDTLVIYR
jgi:hypothetical protein